VAELVLDASFALTLVLVLEEEISARLPNIADSAAIVPAVWPLEVANVLLLALRRKRLDGPTYSEALQRAATIAPLMDAAGLEQIWGRSSELAQRHNLTVYDASYLELALRSGLPLASLDPRLRAATTAEGVPLFP